MGRVWRARDEVLHRDVAIKELVPPPGLTEDERREMRERSLREARAIAQLNDANVVRVFDVLRTDGDPWIVMEYVPSRSLQDVLATEGPLPPARAAEIGLGVLAALRAAHRAGVMHRDVKPGNVLLGDDGRVVLTDFGLATVPGDPSVTRTGLVLGSPAYIAPERARDGSAGPQGDLWSLGATLYAAVEGHSPYARTSAMATLAALATESPTPPRNAGALKPVLTGLLRKDPARRITAEGADRLLRRAAGRRRRGGAAMLDGVRRPSPLGTRGPRTHIVPLPRPAPEPSADGPFSPAPSPEAMAPTTVVSPGSTEPLGAGAAPAKSAPVPPARPLDDAPFAVESDARKPFLSGKRRAWLIGGLAVLLLLAIAVLVPLTGREPEGGDRAQPAPSSTAQDNPPPAPLTSSPEEAPTGAAPSAPPSGSPGFALPAGWHLHRDPTGFSVPLPDGWRVNREKYGPAADQVRVSFQDPRGGRFLLIDQTNSPKSDPVADWTRQEAARKDRYDGYRRVTIEAVDYWDRAADWEWMYNLNGTRVHVRNRGFITAPNKAYGMLWRTPESAWRVNLDEFDLIARGFKPVRD